MKKIGGVDIQSQLFLTSALVAGGGQLHSKASLHSGKQLQAAFVWEARWVPEIVSKVLNLPELEMRPLSLPSDNHPLYRLPYPCSSRLRIVRFEFRWYNNRLLSCSVASSSEISVLFKISHVTTFLYNIVSSIKGVPTTGVLQNKENENIRELAP